MQPLRGLHNLLFENSFNYFRALAFLKNISASSLSDQELLARFRHHGNLEVLSLLYQRYMDLVFGVCLKYLADSELAKDGVMNIFEELVEKLPNHEVENFKGWLYSVAKNHCLMQLRKTKNIKITEITTVVVQTEEILHQNGANGQLFGSDGKEEQFESMETCLKTLPADQQVCVEMFYLQGKSYNEIVTETGYDWKQVRSFIQNGRRNLKICMEKKLSVQR